MKEMDIKLRVSALKTPAEIEVRKDYVSVESY